MKNLCLIFTLAIVLGIDSDIYKSFNRAPFSDKARAAMSALKETDKNDDSEDDDMYRAADEDEDSDGNRGASTGSASKDKKSGDAPGEGDDD